MLRPSTVSSSSTGERAPCSVCILAICSGQNNCYSMYCAGTGACFEGSISPNCTEKRNEALYGSACQFELL